MAEFADVILPLPLKDAFTYRVPDALEGRIRVGQRLVVQFGPKKIYTAIVCRIHNNPPEVYMPKEIMDVMEDFPIVNEYQLKLWEWMADYYMCSRGEVMNAALPSAFKLASETKICLNESIEDIDFALLTDKECLIAEALQIQKVISLDDVSNILGQRNCFKIIKVLIEKGVALIDEQLKDEYKPKIKAFVKLAEEYEDETKLKVLIDGLERKAPKQLDMLMVYFQVCERKNQHFGFAKKSDLMKHQSASSSSLNTLIKKKIIEVHNIQISRLADNDTENNNISTLNEEQNQALVEINKHFKDKDVILLNGITSSGKTEIYVSLMKDVIEQGKQVLYLVPEIALTTQLISRLQKYFGNKIGVYHSRFTKDERVEIWQRILSNCSIESITDTKQEKYNIIIGPRSALFLPFSDLGLIIVDEEHEAAFKQNDPAPRYNGRDTAIYLAKLHKAKTLLGSATPSIESTYNALINKYAVVKLTKRYGDLKLPAIELVDIKEEKRQKRMKSHFSNELIKSIQTALNNKEQVILFQNRRGFSLHLECKQCYWVPGCKNCDVSLVYHKQYNQMRCHYCGYSTPIPVSCPLCNSGDVKMVGFGTEKIEDEMPLFFPNAKVARMDLDTTRSKNAYQEIINNFEEHRVDILVGTQMVTKGLDFDNVSVVGILNADNMLNYPDFRSFERSFQQMSQVSGRAGRKNRQGKVIIQTYNPNHSVFRYILSNDYQGMFENQIIERDKYNYPPFCRLLLITLKDKSQNKLKEAADYLAKSLRKTFSKQVLGPVAPLVSKIKNQYLINIILKLNTDNSLIKQKQALNEKIELFKMTYKSTRIILDIDPQ